MVNNGTGQNYDATIHGYDINGFLIEERLLLNSLNTVEATEDKWIINPEDNDCFKIKCADSGRFLGAKSYYDPKNIMLGNNTIYIS